jgi:hypothetical protein
MNGLINLLISQARKKAMSKSFSAPSLAQLFEAPENYRGCFGWLCGYSADKDFLEDAAFRFTRQSAAQRAFIGNIVLAVMLDPGNLHIKFDEAPGVMHLPIKKSDTKPFSLLHAKVAILGFRHEKEAGNWKARLIVSTGNWTRETLEKSLDLAWCVDLVSDDLKNTNDAIRQQCADIKAAWDLLSWLGNYFDLRILNPETPGKLDEKTGSAKEMVESWIANASSKAKQAKSFFIDNRKKSLCDQLPEMIIAERQVKRNYLGMGSGFFENQTNGSVPSVLDEIVTSLKNHNLLTAKPEKDVFVNPMACQAVASSLVALSKAGFTVRPAGQPSILFGNGLQRSLHAKFIFSANCRENSNYCSSAWVYLGSGNLTGPGFSNRMSATAGNLEAGVVFFPEDLCWEPERGLEPHQLVTNLLPVQWDTDVSDPTISISPGSEMPERESNYTAPPVAWLNWCASHESTCLKAPEGATKAFEILNQDDQICSVDADGNFLWPWKRPLYVILIWQDDGTTRRSSVPVMDEYGRIAATKLSEIELDEAWCQLANFPIPPEDEELPPGDDPPPLDTVNNPTGSTPIIPSPTTDRDYPIRKMMQLIENIAVKQTSILQEDWIAWCTRLEQCLVQAAGSTVVKEFEKLLINPLSPLWEPPFRPLFAETSQTAEGIRYEAVLRKIETEWNPNGVELKRIGGNNGI